MEPELKKLIDQAAEVGLQFSIESPQQLSPKCEIGWRLWEFEEPHEIVGLSLDDVYPAIRSLIDWASSLRQLWDELEQRPQRTEDEGVCIEWQLYHQPTKSGYVWGGRVGRPSALTSLWVAQLFQPKTPLSPTEGRYRIFWITESQQNQVSGDPLDIQYDEGMNYQTVLLKVKDLLAAPDEE